jgi:hypothetical protein
VRTALDQASQTACWELAAYMFRERCHSFRLQAVTNSTETTVDENGD